MRFVFLAPAVLLACGSPADQEPVVDSLLDAQEDRVVAGALPGLSPEPLIDLVEDPRLQLGLDPQCPGSDAAALEETATQSTDREVWSAACIVTPGVELAGELEWLRSPDGMSLIGDRAVLRRDGVVEFALDGGIDLVEHGDRMLVEAAANWCGVGGPACDTDAVTVDLSFSVFPAVNYPHSYDVTVSGAVGTTDSLVSVEGVWSIDDASCADEPASGVLALRSAHRHAFVLDGAAKCDGCAAWSVQGLSAPAWCGLDL